MKENEKLISEFTFFHEPWKIIEVPKISDNGVVYGQTNWEDNTIKIKKDLPTDFKKIILYHELVHVILGSGCWRKENNNEALVEWLAKGINSLQETNILNIYEENGRE